MMRRPVGAAGASIPNRATPFVVPTYTWPLAIVGVMNLLPAPNASRPAGAWFELYSSRERSRASKACKTAGLVFSTAQMIALAPPAAETPGVAPGYVKAPGLADTAAVERRALTMENALRV